MTVDDLRAFARYERRLPGFLRRPVTPDESRRWVEDALRVRAENFLLVLERAVFSNRHSPYRVLLDHAGIALQDVARLVRDEGVEAALGRLYDAGVRVTLEEFKGLGPVERGTLSFVVRPTDFDNPLLDVTVAGSTGGSGSAARRVLLDLDFLEYQIAYDWLIEAAHDGLGGRPVGLWRPILPSLPGLNNALRFAKRGIRVERWFSQNGFRPGRGATKEFVLTASTILASRLFGVGLPAPEYVPAPEAATVARWLARKLQQLAPALLSTPVSGCVRVCQAAQEEGLDISGTVFRIGGEPLTEGKADVVGASGCRALVDYSMAEIGRIGIPCAAPSSVDDVHLVTDKLAVIQRDRAVGHEACVGALHLTTLHPLCPKLMINVESGDHGVLEERKCGCAIGAVGLSGHLHSVRSYEKLSAEGMTYLGGELISLLEQGLPARFGGGPTDYQLVEEEVEGLTELQLLVSPRVGELDEGEVVAYALDALAAGPAYRAMMAGVWRQSGTLRVERREPHVTGAAKILPLQTVKKRSL